MKGRKKIWNAVLTVVLWAAFWQIAAMWIDSRIFLPSPLDVLQSLKGLLMSPEFFHSIAFSLGNIAKGFLLGIVFGSLLAMLASASDFLRTFFALPIRILQATPVASFTILALLWMDSSQLSILISFFMVIPVIYTNVLTGIMETDKELLEMAKVFRVRSYLKIRYLYAPAVLPYLVSACSLAAGLAWKSGVAAEVIGVARNSIGNHLYQAKIYLEIPELFAWTAVTIAVSILFEQLVLRLLDLFYHILVGRQTEEAVEEIQEDVPAGQTKGWAEDVLAERTTEGLTGNGTAEYGMAGSTMGSYILLSDITKAYGEQSVLEKVSLELFCGRPLALMGSSGTGKTTLLRIVLGTELPEEGSIIRNSEARRFAVVFQENRLCEGISVRRNLELICRTRGQKEKIPVLLKRLGLDGCAEQRTSALSGGMKRRLAIGRALLADAPVLLLDEPFQGLDRETKAAIMRLVRERMQGRAVLLVTHDETEAEFLDCSILRL